MTSKQKDKQQELLTAAYYNHSKELNTYAFFKLHSDALCADLVQDTFLKTWKYLVKGGKIDLMKAFLYHVLNNLIIDEYRKNKPVSLDALLEDGFEASVDDSERLFNVLDGKAATCFIRHLPKKYQKVVHMRYVKSLSISEMSLITGQSKNTVAVQAHRGLEKLKLLYNPA